MKTKLFIISLSIASSLCFVSCVDGAKNKSTQTEQTEEISQSERIKQLEQENKRLKQQKEAEQQVRSFTTSSGKWNYDIVLNNCYEKGYEFGIEDKDSPYAESWYAKRIKQFEYYFVHNYGIPSTPEAKEAFEACRKQYLKGLNEGFGK